MRAHVLHNAPLALFTLLTATTTSASDGQASYHDIYQFPNSTFIENIGVRPNGDLLVGLVYRPELWSINPQTSSAVLVHNFTNALGQPNSILGITELNHNVFAIVTSTVTQNPLSNNRGTSAVWRVNFNTGHRHDSSSNNSSSSSSNRHRPCVSLIARIHKGGVLNGLTALLPNVNSTSSPILLAADAADGVVWRINTHTGVYSIALQDRLLSPPGTGPFATFGVNGIQLLQLPSSNSSNSSNNSNTGAGNVDDNHKLVLYFTNTGRQLLGRVPLNPVDGSAAGAFKLVANTHASVDDFALGPRGNAFVAQESTITRYASAVSGGDGSARLVLGSLNSTVIAGSTAAQFGRRGTAQERVLFVTTNGGLLQPANGTSVEGGKIVAVDVGSWEDRECVKVGTAIKC